MAEAIVAWLLGVGAVLGVLAALLVGVAVHGRLSEQASAEAAQRTPVVLRLLDDVSPPPDLAGRGVLTVPAHVTWLGSDARQHQAVTMAARPTVPAIACFDTAFHTTMPAEATTYAVPARWRTELAIRRYGFHGLAHEWAARRAVALCGPLRRIVVAHLGSGASLCAVRDGRSIDTTMGFTPTAGLVMGTRCGDIDPAIPGWLLDQAGLRADEVADALNHASGLRALAGTEDMREVLAAEADGDAGAALAVEVWLHRLRQGIAAMTPSLGGLDALVFSGGIGERSAPLRRRALDGLGFLGLHIDDTANARASRDLDGRDSWIHADSGIHTGLEGPRVLVVRAREELIMAEQARSVLNQPACQVPAAGDRSRR